MRSVTPGQAVPSKDAAEQAVDIAIQGKRARVIVNQVVTEGPATVAAGSVSSHEADTPLRSFVWWLVAIATVVAAVAGVWALFLR